MMFARIRGSFRVWLSSTAQQAMSAVLCIAGADVDGPVRVEDIARVIGCPRNYLSKTLNQLVRAGVLRSERGPRGGFRLALSPDELTIARVITPFEPVGERRCLLGRASCGGEHPCGAHQRWSRVTGGVDDFFATTTVASVLRGNPAVSTAARNAAHAVHHSNQTRSHGSVA
jgi:Rrf2 family iron-sulfur cluster assembly transcriptional regulator